MTLRELRAALLKAGMSVDALWRKIEGIAIKAVLSAEERLVQYRYPLRVGLMKKRAAYDSTTQAERPFSSQN